jgi:L-fuculose-phosphate aldolase
MNEKRRAIIDACRRMARTGLTPGKSGNASLRDAGGMLITPSGIAYEKLKPSDIAVMTLGGERQSGKRTPSSEWPFHAAIYRAHPEIGAIVHCHSRFATALACLHRDIPAFHYMVAVAGGESIRCAPYATFGTNALADHAVTALAGGRRACLLANHGQIATGNTLERALELAVAVEALAAQYVTALGVGEPRLLDAAEMALNIEKFKTYGQPRRVRER